MEWWAIHTQDYAANLLDRGVYVGEVKENRLVTFARGAGHMVIYYFQK